MGSLFFTFGFTGILYSQRKCKTQKLGPYSRGVFSKHALNLPVKSGISKAIFQLKATQLLQSTTRPLHLSSIPSLIMPNLLLSLCLLRFPCSDPNCTSIFLKQLIQSFSNNPNSILNTSTILSPPQTLTQFISYSLTFTAEHTSSILSPSSLPWTLQNL